MIKRVISSYSRFEENNPRLNRVLQDLFVGTNRFEYETLLQLPFKARLIALTSLVSMYLVFLVIIHLGLFRHYNYEPEGVQMFRTVYLLMFLGLTGSSFLTIINPRLFKYKVLLNVISVIITGIGVSILALQLAWEMQHALGIHDKSAMFVSVPSGTALASMGIGYLLFFVATRLSVSVINQINIKKIEIETEVELARQIQESINTEINVDANSFQAFGKVIPANEVGGDYLELIDAGENQILAIGDVSGHDIASGLLMGMTKSAFSTEIRYEKEAAKQLSSLNQSIYQFSSKEKFVSFLSVKFNFNKMEMICTNAGHHPILVYYPNKNELKEINPEGMILGVVKDATFDVEKVQLEEGMIIMAYTDGLIEARNKEDEEYGLDRLRNSLIQNQTMDSRFIYENIISDLEGFTAKVPFEDDISLFVLKVKRHGTKN